MLTFDQPSNTGEHLISFSTQNANGNLSLYVVARQYPNSAVSCTYIGNVFDSLGQATLDGPVASCTMEAGEHEPLKVVFTLVTSSGERIELDKDVYEISTGTSETVNISVVN